MSATRSWRRRHAADSISATGFTRRSYPISGDLSAWGYRWGSNPVAERVASEIVNLPTDIAPEGREQRAVEDLLEASVDRIVRGV